MDNIPLTTKISENYETLKVLGQGCYGQVIKCLKRDTKETVAVKVLLRKSTKSGINREVFMLEKLRVLDPDMFNIVRCHESFNSFDRTFMVFEILDMSLFDYISQKKGAPLPLNGIRTIIRDLAIAFLGLKVVGLIHTDVKLDNIMLVDHERQPFRVKLIDFGLTIDKSEVTPGLGVQPLRYRSPEVILGVPFTEAIDIWSLGSVMAELLVGFSLFPGRNEYDLLRFMTDILGKPTSKLLNLGTNTSMFFNGKSKFNLSKEWTLKTPTEFQAETKVKPVDTRRRRFSSLDELKTFSNSHKGKSEADAERSACFDLLKEMLQLDPTNRITPVAILAHPFTSRNYLSTHNDAAPVETSVDQAISNAKSHVEIKADDRTSPPRVIMVQPAEKNMRSDNVTEQRGDMSPQGMHPQMTSLEAMNKRDLLFEPATVTTPCHRDLDVESLSDSDIADSGLVCNIKGIRPLVQNPLHVEEEVEHEKKKKKKKKKGLRKFFSTLKRKFLCCFCFREDNYVYDF